MKALSENKAPDDEKIKCLGKDIQEVEESFDKEKNVIFNVAFRSMKKLLDILSEWNKNHRAELNISKEEDAPRSRNLSIQGSVVSYKPEQGQSDSPGVFVSGKPFR